MEYVSLLNEDLYKGIGLSENTFIKHRQSLIDQNYFDTKKIRQGKSFTLQYRPNWSKLQKLDFIKPSVENAYALPKKEYKSKVNFKKGDLITMENRDRLNDDTSYIYELTTYEKDKQIGSPQESYTFGKQLKLAVRSNDNFYQRNGYHQEEYRYLETKK
ncbi:hypothetical protein DHD05_18900 [Arenibacter sp. N53]|nr:hypothetical protein [Arenibacter sp. N53]